MAEKVVPLPVSSAIARRAQPAVVVVGAGGKLRPGRPGSEVAWTPQDPSQAMGKVAGRVDLHSVRKRSSAREDGRHVRCRRHGYLFCIPFSSVISYIDFGLGIYVCN